jgi:hypothetical protein
MQRRAKDQAICSLTIKTLLITNKGLSVDKLCSSSTSASNIKATLLALEAPNQRTMVYSSDTKRLQIDQYLSF